MLNTHTITSASTQTQETIVMTDINKFMFNNNNITTGYFINSLKNTLPPHPRAPSSEKQPIHIIDDSVAIKVKKENELFIPGQVDKLFWCFYIILNGYENYEFNKTNSFSIEKQFKLEAVEKLKTIKHKLKEIKLKRTELENELANMQKISIKGLYALCLIYNISITYIYGRKYCIIPSYKTNTDGNDGDDGDNSKTENNIYIKQGIIRQNNKKEDCLYNITDGHENNNDTPFLNKIKDEYWHIENIQKPLKTSSAYTLKELQDICIKLEIDITNFDSEKNKSKPKTKQKLYQDILEKL